VGRGLVRGGLVAALCAGVAACGGSAHVGTPAATPPAPSQASVATARQPSASAVGADWPTYHDVNARTGAVTDGPPLGHAHRLWSVPVDGAVYAEPLIVGGRVIVATENDSVYAFDAKTGTRLWGVHLGTPVSGGSLPCGDIDPSGITSTPVADPRSGTVYVVMYHGGFQHTLVALNVGTGAVRWERPIDPPGGDYKTEQQRAALALANGRVYVSYGGLFGDCGQYHGWVVGASASGPGGALITYQVPSQREGAIWAASGPAVDGAGNLYVATGNGSSSSFDYGNAVIRLTSSLQPTGFFAPSNAGALNVSDSDLGSTGPLLLPGSRVFIMGKAGVAYLLDANHLGGVGNALASANVGAAAFGGDAYANGIVYVPTAGGLIAFQVGPDSLHKLWSQGAAGGSPIVAGPGLWSLGNGVLDQLDPATGAVRYQASVGQAAHFATPAASGGRIFVAADGRVLAFG
jgi:outer membrane protein assembly factor BamB